MRSTAFIFMLLVVMVTSDDMSTSERQQQQPSQNETEEVSNDYDASNFTDDDLGLDENAVQPPTKQLRRSRQDPVECRINSEQFENLNEKLLELELQLEVLQNSVDRIQSGTPTKTVSGIQYSRTI